MAKKAFKRLRIATPPRCSKAEFAGRAPLRGGWKLTFRYGFAPGAMGNRGDRCAKAPPAGG
jgi:hypothetical protein